MSKPIAFRAQYDGEGFRLRHTQIEQADRQFAIGEWYWITQHEERSKESHGHFFACVTKVWENLPEPWDDQFPTPEHLRHFVLIKTGYRSESLIVFKDEAEARRTALLLHGENPFCVFHVDGNLIRRWEAESQKKRHMGVKRFQESKQACFDYFVNTFGIDPELLKAYAHHTT